MQCCLIFFHNAFVLPAYAANQGLSESVLGILMGSSAVFGIIGTFAYPIIRHRVGLVRTGLIALSCEVSCLTLCVASIWMPGSPFDPTYRKAGHTSVCNKVNTSVSLAVSAQVIVLRTKLKCLFLFCFLFTQVHLQQHFTYVQNCMLWKFVAL